MGWCRRRRLCFVEEPITAIIGVRTPKGVNPVKGIFISRSFLELDDGIAASGEAIAVINNLEQSVLILPAYAGAAKVRRRVPSVERNEKKGGLDVVPRMGIEVVHVRTALLADAKLLGVGIIQIHVQDLAVRAPKLDVSVLAIDTEGPPIAADGRTWR